MKLFQFCCMQAMSTVSVLVIQDMSTFFDYTSRLSVCNDNHVTMNFVHVVVSISVIISV